MKNVYLTGRTNDLLRLFSSVIKQFRSNEAHSKISRDNKGRRLAAIKNKNKIKPELGSKQKTQTLALNDTTVIKSEPSRYAEEDGKADPALRRFIPTQYQIHLPGQWLIQSVKMANLVA